MPYKNKKTGQVISDNDFMSQKSNFVDSIVDTPTEKTTQQTGKVNFWQRLKLGFGGKEAKEEQQRLEKEAGLKGKLDIGDIADVFGAILPIAGSVVGAAGGVLGSAGGAAAGQAVRRTIGGLIGADKPTASDIAKDVALTGIGTYVGGKVLGGLFNLMSKSIPNNVMSTIFKQSADDIGLGVKTGGKNLTQAQEVLKEGFRGSPQKMMTFAFDTMKNLETQAQALVKGKPVVISNKNGYINLIKDYVSNLKKSSFGFQNNVAKEGKEIISQLTKLKGNKISGELALATRRFIDGARRTSSFKLNSNLLPKEAAYKTAADSLRKSLTTQIKGLGGVMNRYSIHVNAFEDLAKYASKAQNRELFDLIDVFIMYGINPSAYLARRGLMSATAKTNLSQGLYRAGQAIEKVVPKGLVPSLTTRGIMGTNQNQ
jgi:hypothetical protein